MMRKNESGQALVLVLLSLSVVLTLVLFILSRSITDVAVSSTQEQSVRAFSAAEAGIERSLVTNLNSADSGIDASYNANVSGLAEGLGEFIYPFPLSSGDSATIWFMAHDPSGNLTLTGAFTGSGMTVCWGNSGTSGSTDATPAIEVSVYYETNPGHLDSIQIARAAYDPWPGRTPPNSFDTLLGSGTCPVSRSYQFKKSIVFPSDFVPSVNTGGLLFARIRMFYNDTPQWVGVSVTGDNLPSQGQQIDSSGVAGGSNRRIVVKQPWPVFPFASNAVFSPVEGITQ